ncbi:MAG: hypothetical protein ABR585_10080 [Gemmatimonadaceae bacterium]
MGAAGAVAVAAMRRREQEVIDDFRAAGALSPDTAQSYSGLGFGQSRAIQRLRNRAVIREAAPDKFYLDEEVWAAVRRTRRRLATVMMAILLVMLLGVLARIIK